MDSVAAFEPVVRLAWGTALVSVALSAALVVQVLRMRRRLARRERRAQEVFARWRPILFEAVAGGSPSLPALPREEEDAFLLLWIQLLDGIRGDSVARLAEVGARMGARRLALERIDGGEALGRVLALRTFGYLQRPEDRERVLRWLDDPRSYISLAAARALVRIDPERAADELLPRLVARADWPVPLFADVLAQASPARLSARLSARFAALCAELPPAPLARLLPLASIVDEHVVDALLRRLLSPGQEPEVLAAALRLVRSPALLEPVRRAASHEAWSVRVQAAAALGRVGEPRDRELVAKLLRDAEWWVRYRAAQALVTRPYGAPGELRALAGSLDDRFARDMVQQVLAEVRA
ncbi:HEAT repeat domain-containing protein [Anaeromyxobacter oryzisoli]|uniref:HEAT repeat domain-containing protein n=1 Tax=Anaeromyxobacter oryzisoli TaxID=2925408 RepID=UPI001F5AE53F|nr:HEAT repeat domain-containing protein [Anaeromyxobacter sp. SG63]